MIKESYEDRKTQVIKTIAMMQSDQALKDELTRLRGTRIYTFGELTAHIKNLLDSDANLNEIF